MVVWGCWAYLIVIELSITMNGAGVVEGLIVGTMLVGLGRTLAIEGACVAGSARLGSALGAVETVGESVRATVGMPD